MKIDFTSPTAKIAIAVLGGAFIGFVFGAVEPLPSKNK